MSKLQPPLFPEYSNERGESTKQTALHLLALSRVRGLGFITLRRLFERHPVLEEVWDVPDRQLLSVVRRARAPNAEGVVSQMKRDQEKLIGLAQRDIEALNRRGIHVLIANDEGFPPSLRAIHDPPYWLFVQGDPRLLTNTNVIALVGTRRPTQYGLNNAKALSEWLVRHDFTVLSGLAEGIDAVAHQTAVDYGAPNIAVLGTGILVVFPSVTSGLRQDIVDIGGALVTEYLPNDSYSRARFVQRNRIQAALSYAVVPIQCQVESGTARTIRFATQYGKLVFGVKRGTPEDIKENEVYRVLREQHARIFDLESDADMQDLYDVLRPALLETKRKPQTSFSSRRLFTKLLREFDRIITKYPVTDADIEALKDKITERWNRR